MTYLLIVLVTLLGNGTGILARSSSEGHSAKRGCCQERSDTAVQSVPTVDSDANTKPCCATSSKEQNAVGKPTTPGTVTAESCCGSKKDTLTNAAKSKSKKPKPSCAELTALRDVTATRIEVPGSLSHPTIRRAAINATERFNTNCPVCNRRVGDDPGTVSYNGFQIGVCPGICRTTFQDISAIEKDSFIARFAEPISSRCAVTGCQCPTGSHRATCHGSVVSLCCDTCRNYWYDSDEATRASWVYKNIQGIAAIEPDGQELRTLGREAIGARLTGSALMAKTTPNTTLMEVSEMTCQACVDKVALALKSISGVKTVQIDLDKKLVRVETESVNAIPAGKLAKAVETAGFSAKILERTAPRYKESPADAGVSAESSPPSVSRPTCSGQVRARMVLLGVDGMVGEADAKAVEDALNAMKGVLRTTVDRESKLVDILVDLAGPVDAERAAKFLSLAGYDAKEASQEQYDTELERLRRGGAIVQLADLDEIEEQ